jgi:hypothetical protein
MRSRRCRNGLDSTGIDDQPCARVCACLPDKCHRSIRILPRVPFKLRPSRQPPEGGFLVTTVASTSAYDVVRSQFRTFDEIGSEISLTDEDRQRMLRLSAWEWLAWSKLRNGGAVPEEPVVPVMLRRLGVATHRLAVAAERRGERGADAGSLARAPTMSFRARPFAADQLGSDGSTARLNLVERSRVSGIESRIE